MIFFTLPLFTVSLGILGRLALIFIGTYKAPLLQLFEKYGDDENRFFPLPRLLFWMGMAMASGADVLSWGGFFIPETVGIIGILFMLMSYCVVMLPMSLRDILDEFPPLPTWYHRLRKHTSREERRRIAYVWLKLPRKTRLLLNSNNHAFFLWTELIILSTT